ncbi:MAG: VOC family protein [Myxococcota bacterium]
MTAPRTEPLAPRGLHFFVTDMSRTLAFYRRAGVEIPAESVWSVGGKEHHVEIELPQGLTLAFDSIELTRGYDPGCKAPSGPAHNVLIFNLPTREAVDARHADLTSAGHASHLAPHDAFWGARYAIVLDPDGSQVGFMSPSDPARRRPPPSPA